MPEQPEKLARYRFSTTQITPSLLCVATAINPRHLGGGDFLNLKRPHGSSEVVHQLPDDRDLQVQFFSTSPYTSVVLQNVGKCRFGLPATAIRSLC